MDIYGLQKTTLLDFPGHVACTVFSGGCNFRCPFCQNREVVFPGKPVQEEMFFHFLEKRQGVLEGVCITGGEPTLASDLGEFIDRIHSLGYLVKLDTNGYRPHVLCSLFARHAPDYVAMDVKAVPSRYSQACGIDGVDISRIQESVRLIQNSGIPYEFRTTVAREFHSMEDFQKLGAWLSGSQTYCLQSYRDCETLSGLHFTPYTKKELETAAGIVRKYIPGVFLRGV